MSEFSKGYQYEWFRYDWQGMDLCEETSSWEMFPILFDTKKECEEAAAAHSEQDHVPTRILYFDGEDWHFQQQPPPEPDFEAERKYFGSWITHDKENQA